MAGRSRGQVVAGELAGAARRVVQGNAVSAMEGAWSGLGASGRVGISSLRDGLTQTSTSTGGFIGSTRANGLGGGVRQAVRSFTHGRTHSSSQELPSFPRFSLRSPHGMFPSTATMPLQPRVGAQFARHGKKIDYTKVFHSRRAASYAAAGHPASSRVAVEAGGASARQLLRNYGVPLLLGAAAVGGKLGYDYYKDYEERHNLLKPWKGEMIKIDGLNALQAPPITVLGKTLEGFHIVVRTFQLTLLFLPLLATAPFAYYSSVSGIWRERWRKLLLQTLMLAGPAFMKWGQWAAARPDLFPEDIARELEALHMAAPTHPYKYTRRVIKDAFGYEIDELFSEFEKEPIASGTIGQVYRAVISSSGSALLGAANGQPPPPADMVVAVKVRHPGVQEAIRYDFTVIRLLSSALNLIPSLEWLHLDEMTWQFETLLGAQVDFTVEGERLALFNRNFRKWNYVAFPKPIIAHPAALVETFEEGVSLNQYTRNEEEGSMMNRILAKLGLSVVLKMMLVDNLVHADLHPGNILVRDLPPFSLPVWESFWRDLYERLPWGGPLQMIPQMVLVDAGMTATLQSTDSWHLVRFFQAVTKFDGAQMSRAMIDFSVNFPVELHERFSHDMIALMGSFDHSYKTSEWNSFSECLAGAMGCVRDYRLCIEGAVCTMIVTSMMLSDMQQRLDPECGVIPVLDKILLGRSISNFIPSLEDAVEYLISKNSVTLAVR